MKLSRIALLLVFCFVIPFFTPQAEAVSGKKVLIGLGVMVGGAALFFSTRWGSDSGPIAGLVVFGAGTGIFIWGLASHNTHTESKLQQRIREERRSRISYVVFPAQKGRQGAVVLRW